MMTMFFKEEEGEEENEAVFIILHDNGGSVGLDHLDGSIVLEMRNWFMAILFLWLCRQAVRIGLRGTYWNTNTGNG